MKAALITAAEFRRLMSEPTRYERMAAIFLDRNGRSIAAGILAQGCQDMVEFDLGDLASMVEETGAMSVVLAHTHPCEAKPKPSKEDITTTKIVHQKLMEHYDVDVKDHYIFGRGGRAVFSFARNMIEWK